MLLRLQGPLVTSIENTDLLLGPCWVSWDPGISTVRKGYTPLYPSLTRVSACGEGTGRAQLPYRFQFPNISELAWMVGAYDTRQLGSAGCLSLRGKSLRHTGLSCRWLCTQVWELAFSYQGSQEQGLVYARAA